MPSKNPQVSIRLTPDEYSYLQGLAERNFVTLPQFVKILVKRAIAEDKERQNKQA
ncbi:hypothetical protein NIES4101_26400 (plasmid) [Calothrix sp. NIES-4101]|uniref:hypothetical protein n=1 Tax=Calothrix sp. UHCC 0171 TaxID=3110245 RepID=UPI000B5FCF30|nr:hypothetical protein [Calothrix sp. UHCC 0171]MEA5574162.1 hypothetical protein [Calothrix sp. UHCC 0171]BAZ36720.1 hypothetical protein NIES4101_26400 [Calothrix sp. NIES-4101]